MKQLRLLALSVFAVLGVNTHAETSAKATQPAWSLAIHGGAGTITPDRITPEQASRIKASLQAALAKGAQVLKNNGSALDAVEATLIVLEDAEDFNAGKGAVFNAKGEHELDASIMDGASLNAGAVAGISFAKNPIMAARRVLDASPHVLLQGEGANEFIKQQNLPLVPNSYFSTEYRRQQFKKARTMKTGELEASTKFGTVGAVALDSQGNLAAATSTGGMTNKSFGRVGDSPIIGAGTYAQNGVCAVSATGEGEYFIRLSIARTICAEVEYNKASIKQAADTLILGKLSQLGGTGGVIAMDGQGSTALVFNTAGMYRGEVKAGQKPVVSIFKE